MADACILECQRIGGLEKYSKYRGEEESLEIFLTLLRLTKDFDARILLTSDVAGKLDSISDKPEFVAIARALCLAEDGNPTEAVAQLDKLDAQLAETKDHREYKHIPLYKASILFKEGTDYSVAETAFAEFMKRNEGKNKKIVASALRLSRDIEMKESDRSKVDEFITYVINTGWFNNEEIRKDFSDDDIASMYDMKQMGLAWSGKFDESASICRYVFTTYPQTLAAATCLRYYASYIGWHDNDKEGAIKIYKDLLENSPHESAWIGAVCALSRIAFSDKDYDSAFNLCQEALNRMAYRCKGHDAEHRRKYKNFLHEIIEKKVQSKSETTN